MSTEAELYDYLYDTKAWRGRNGLQKRAIARDGGKCQVCRIYCAGKKGQDNAPIADHIVPHKGDPDLFFDMNNLQCLCTRCYNRKLSVHGVLAI